MRTASLFSVSSLPRVLACGVNDSYIAEQSYETQKTPRAVSCDTAGSIENTANNRTMYRDKIETSRCCRLFHEPASIGELERAYICRNRCNPGASWPVI